MSRILIIEDDPTLQDAYSFILKTDGHKVISALNGMEGLVAAQKDTYDIILLDIHMPVMDGWEFLRRFQPHRSIDTKIVVFSNMVEPDLQKEAMSFGVNRSILKSSMTPRSMLALIEDVAAS